MILCQDEVFLRVSNYTNVCVVVLLDTNDWPMCLFLSHFGVFLKYCNFGSSTKLGHPHTWYCLRSTLSYYCLLHTSIWYIPLSLFVGLLCRLFFTQEKNLWCLIFLIFPLQCRVYSHKMNPVYYYYIDRYIMPFWFNARVPLNSKVLSLLWELSLNSFGRKYHCCCGNVEF